MKRTKIMTATETILKANKILIAHTDNESWHAKQIFVTGLFNEILNWKLLY